MRFQTVLAILAAILADQAVLAEPSEIVGAFGVTFGETVTEDMSAKCSDETHCIIKPKSPYYAFSNYQVALTENKKRIYQITGSGHPDSFRECNALAENVARILTQKYDLRFESSEYEGPNGMLIKTWSVTIGQRLTGLWALEPEVTDSTKRVTILCHDYSGIEGWTGGGILNLKPITLTIRYTSNAVISNENLEIRMDERGL